MLSTLDLTISERFKELIHGAQSPTIKPATIYYFWSLSNFTAQHRVTFRANHNIPAELGELLVKSTLAHF